MRWAVGSGQWAVGSRSVQVNRIASAGAGLLRAEARTLKPWAPPGLAGPASTLGLSETESANLQSTPKLSWPSLRTTRDVIGKARYKEP